MKILPRLLLEGWSMADFQEVFASEASMKEVGNFIVKNLKVSTCMCFNYIKQKHLRIATLYMHNQEILFHCSVDFPLFPQKHKFDGMVLEVWSQLGGHYKRCALQCTSTYAAFVLDIQ